MQLSLTAQERSGLTALAAGLRKVAETDLTEEDALVAALELALTHLVEEYEVPDPQIRHQVHTARDNLRAHWTRGAASL